MHIHKYISYNLCVSTSIMDGCICPRYSINEAPRIPPGHVYKDAPANDMKYQHSTTQAL